jgi:predicted DNA-binding transcriptional regulator YafY
LQLALTNFYLVRLKYHSPDSDQITERTIEPFAVYSTQENWLLIAFCLLRQDFRAFRLDRIQNLTTLNEQFEPHKMTLQEYFEICKKKYSSQPLT